MKGINRVTANSKAGRQMTSGGGKNYYPSTISSETDKWNAEIDAKKAAKKERRKCQQKQSIQSD